MQQGKRDEIEEQIRGIEQQIAALSDQKKKLLQKLKKDEEAIGTGGIEPKGHHNEVAVMLHPRNSPDKKKQTSRYVINSEMAKNQFNVGYNKFVMIHVSSSEEYAKIRIENPAGKIWNLLLLLASTRGDDTKHEGRWTIFYKIAHVELLNLMDQYNYEVASCFHQFNVHDCFQYTFKKIDDTVEASVKSSIAPPKQLPISEKLLFNIQEHVLKITINDRSFSRFITNEMLLKLTSAIKYAEVDKNVTTVVLCGLGDNFEGALDMSPFFNSKLTASEIDNMATQTAKRVKDLSLIDFSKLLISCINGAVFGFSTSILPLFDIVLASKTATFETPCTEYDFPLGASAFTFPLVMGIMRTNAVLLLGTKLSADEALDHHLVHRLFEKVDFAEKTGAFFETYGKSPLDALKRKRNCIRHFNRKTLHQINEAECKTFAELLRNTGLKSIASAKHEGK